jgi:hypothetical protein
MLLCAGSNPCHTGDTPDEFVGLYSDLYQQYTRTLTFEAETQTSMTRRLLLSLAIAVGVSEGGRGGEGEGGGGEGGREIFRFMLLSHTTTHACMHTTSMRTQHSDIQDSVLGTTKKRTADMPGGWISLLWGGAERERELYFAPSRGV